MREYLNLILWMDHFPIFLVAKTERKMIPEEKIYITKRLINNKTKENF